MSDTSIPNEHERAINESVAESNKSSTNESNQSSQFRSSVFLKKVVVKVLRRLRFIMYNLTPFPNYENSNIRKHMNYESMEKKTLLLYIDKLVKKVKLKVFRTLSNRFAALFDG